MKKAILILAGQYTACIATHKTWLEQCLKYHIVLETCNVDDENGKSYVLEYKLKSFPTLIIDNKVVAVGHPDKMIAEKLFAQINNQ